MSCCDVVSAFWTSLCIWMVQGEKPLLDAEEGLPSISLEVDLCKCGVHGGGAEEVAAMAKELASRHLCQVRWLWSATGRSHVHGHTNLRQKAEVSVHVAPRTAQCTSWRIPW